MKKWFVLLILVLAAFDSYSQIKLWPFVHNECIPDQDPGNMAAWKRVERKWEILLLDQLGCDRCGGNYQIYVDKEYTKLRFMAISRDSSLQDIVIPTIGIICNLWQNGELQYLLGPDRPNESVTIEIKYTNNTHCKYPLKLFIQDEHIGIVVSIFGKVIIIPCNDAFHPTGAGKIIYRNIYSLVGWPMGVIPGAKNYLPEIGNWIEW